MIMDLNSIFRKFDNFEHKINLFRVSDMLTFIIISIKIKWVLQKNFFSKEEIRNKKDFKI